MKVGIPREIATNERRVAVTPGSVARIIKLGLDVIVQSGAGEGAESLDATYAEVGATIVPDAETLWAEADIVLKVRPPQELPDGRHEADLLREGAFLIGFIWPAQHAPLLERLAKRSPTVLAMDAMPRITRAQKMDALSVFANIVGYRAVIEAAAQFGMFFPGQITAAGRVKPAQVMVIGAGVAGLAAIAAARSLGAQVRAFDTRPSVREQVQSLGATFLPFEFKESGEGAGGYAKEMSPEYIAAEQALIAANAKDVDIIISTAVVPGKPAPQLITSGAVVSMHHGSIIVDLAAEQGGNCPLTERDKIVQKFGVTIVGLTDFASRMAHQSSDLYGTTVYNLLADVYDAEKKAIVLNLEDEIHRGVVILDQGKLMWPPPSRPKPRSVDPAPPKPQPVAAPPAPKPSVAGPIFLGAVSVLLFVAGLFARGEFLEHLTVFLLAVVVGWHVVWNVTPALHTPLMSVTNAISGIILIGGVMLLRTGGLTTATTLAAVAILLASINVAGGFLVTQRMLRMFRR
jgi:NAD(P) transhydrogenase subunit alpha